jgi:hypothetical protein
MVPFGRNAGSIDYMIFLSNEPNPLDFMDVLPNPNLARPLRTRELLVKPTTFLF